MTTFAQVLDAELRSPQPTPTAPAGRSEPSLEDLQRTLDALPIGRRARRPAWAVELDVDLPCDAQTVRKAFRRRALQTHPDRPGGSHEAFLHTLQALDEGTFAIAGS